MSAGSTHAAATDDPTLRPRRSVLYMPGANEKALEKAKGLDADALILDLEDSVAPDMKVTARERVCAAATSGAYGSKELTIRVNSLDTGWFAADMAAASKAGPAAIVVPKVSSVDDVRTIESHMEKGGAPDTTRIWAMIETPVAMLHAEEISACSERLAVLVMGTNDLAKELRAQHVPGRQPLLTGLSLCLLGARAAGKAVLDGVYNNVKDPDGFLAECRQGFEMGFDGKTLIHPSQIEPCNQVWAPSDEQVAEAQALIEVFEAGIAEGKGVVTYNGKMVENLHVEGARRTLAFHQAITSR